MKIAAWLGTSVFVLLASPLVGCGSGGNAEGDGTALVVNRTSHRLTAWHVTRYGMLTGAVVGGYGGEIVPPLEPGERRRIAIPPGDGRQTISFKEWGTPGTIGDYPWPSDPVVVEEGSAGRRGAVSTSVPVVFVGHDLGEALRQIHGRPLEAYGVHERVLGAAEQLIGALASAGLHYDMASSSSVHPTVDETGMRNVGRTVLITRYDGGPATGYAR